MHHIQRTLKLNIVRSGKRTTAKPHKGLRRYPEFPEAVQPGRIDEASSARSVGFEVTTSQRSGCNKLSSKYCKAGTSATDYAPHRYPPDEMNSLASPHSLGIETLDEVRKMLMLLKIEVSVATT